MSGLAALLVELLGPGTIASWSSTHWKRLFRAGALGGALLLFGQRQCVTICAAPSASVGLNFTASTYNLNAVALPPDCNGAVGPEHFVEFINGSFAVYSKTNGETIKRVTDVHFWSTAGVVLSPDDATTDPRIIYDPTVQRWFASMVDASAAAVDPTMNANDFLFAVSAGPDPTGAWHGFLFQADPGTGYFADFPTLGVDQNAVYIAGDFFHGSNSPAGPGLVSVPKTDLLAATPSIASRKWFGVMDYTVRGQVLQPATCFDRSTSGQILAVSDIGSDSNPHSNLVSFAVLNPGGPDASLSTSTFVPTDEWQVPDNADYGAPLLVVGQPDGTSTLMANDARLSAKVYAVGGVLYAVHSTETNNRVAIRWYRLRASDHVLLESGTMTDPNLDFFFPSIAANSNGVVAIAYNGSGAGIAVSCFAVVGQTIGDKTTFGDPVLLQSGAASYHGDDEVLAELLGSPPFSRWGDYSAISTDPSEPNRFWIIGMFPSDPANSDVWSTQVTELLTLPDARQALLAIERTPVGVQISWPAGLSGYRLEANPDLTDPAGWSYITQPVETAGDRAFVSLPLSPGNRFFRLRQP